MKQRVRVKDAQPPFLPPLQALQKRHSAYLVGLSDLERYAPGAEAVFVRRAWRGGGNVIVCELHHSEKACGRVREFTPDILRVGVDWPNSPAPAQFDEAVRVVMDYVRAVNPRATLTDCTKRAKSDKSDETDPRARLRALLT